MLLTEFDANKTAMINPEKFYAPVAGMPKVAVACYSHITFARMLAELGGAEIIAESHGASGTIPIYKTSYRGTDVALFMILAGAPMSAGALEEIYAMGVEKAVVFGTCGVLDKNIGDCAVIIPDAALRDEGTSYHYAPPSDEIEVNRRYMGTFTKLLDGLHVAYTVGKTWTTDAFYRETPDKVKRRKEQGCVCVEMECAADAAVAAFRGKELVQFFYAADNLDAGEWEERSLSSGSMLEEKDRIAALALELAVRIR